MDLTEFRGSVTTQNIGSPDLYTWAIDQRKMGKRGDLRALLAWLH